MFKAVSTILALVALSQTGLAKEYVFAGQDFPPFNWDEKGTAKGGMVEIMQEVCKDLKHTCKFMFAPTPRVLDMLKKGEIAGALSYLSTPDRLEYTTFSAPVIVTPVSYMGTAKTPKISKIADLNGWSIGAVRQSGTGKIALKHKEEVKTIQMQEEVDNETLLRKLTGDRYGDKAVVIGSEDVLNFLAKKIGVQLLVALKLEEQFFPIAFSKKGLSAEEIEQFEKALTKMKTNGTAKKILESHGLKLAN